jgi:hypothetical protein
MLARRQYSLGTLLMVVQACAIVFALLRTQAGTAFVLIAAYTGLVAFAFHPTNRPGVWWVEMLRLLVVMAVSAALFPLVLIVLWLVWT